MKLGLGLVFALILLIFSFGNARASIVLISKEGRMVVKVLGLTIPQRESLEVKDLALAETSSSKVTLAKEGGKISLVISGDGEDKELDVTNYKDDLIEIEERPELERVKIGIFEGKFSLMQRDVIALTDFPIEVNSEEAQVLLTTPSGKRTLAILPLEAVEAVLRAKILTKTDQKFNLVEDEGDFAYVVSGKRILNLFGLVNYEVDVKTNVSALTGEIISVEEPSWLKIFGFLFS